MKDAGCMTYQTLPYLTRAEYHAILDKCTRTDSGCLLFDNGTPRRPACVIVRGRQYSVLRLMWAETHGTSLAAMQLLDTHEVMHIVSCINTGDYGGRSRRPLCIEPAHLCLGTTSDHARMTVERERRMREQTL